MALCDVLAVFTTPMHSGIKDSTSTFDGSYGQSDQLRSPEGKKKSLALSTFGRRNGSATCGTFVSYQSPSVVERQMSLSRLYELKNEIKSFFEKTKTFMLNFIMKGLLWCLRTWPMYSTTSTT